jgi:hypothetical protein
VEQLRTVLTVIDRFDKEIERVASALPDYALFRSLPGAGPHLAPRLLAAFGEQRERFHGADELQRYSGIAPVTERSGKKSWVHWRWQCPTFLRQTFVEWAGQTINKSFWAGAYYRQQRAKGSTYQAAVRALAFKWIRILYRCWQTRTLYDETGSIKATRNDRRKRRIYLGRCGTELKKTGETDLTRAAGHGIGTPGISKKPQINPLTKLQRSTQNPKTTQRGEQVLK